MICVFWLNLDFEKIDLRIYGLFCKELLILLRLVGNRVEGVWVGMCGVFDFKDMEGLLGYGGNNCNDVGILDEGCELYFIEE